MAKYEEKEITQPVKLCLDNGDLNTESAGWSCTPLHICNLSGNWPKKKKWNFWLVLGPDFGFSATVANVDYIGLGAVSFVDLKKKVTLNGVAVIPRGKGVDMPETVEEDVVLKRKDMRISFTHPPGQVKILVESPTFQAGKLTADISLDRPAAHETLNTVIPWSDKLFHFTSKQNTLPARGSVTFGGVTYEFNPENSFGVLDFGRGIWPETINWNWGAFSHYQDGDLIGVNMGAKWTDGTGHNENGIMLNGRLTKIMEDIIFDYDTSDFMKPWKIKSSETDILDLVLTPVYDNGAGVASSSDSKQVAASNHQMFGRFNGVLKPEGKTINLKNAFGWAEQHIGKW